MHDLFYLAWRYLIHHRRESWLLFAAMALCLSVPVTLRALVSTAQAELLSRAEASPLIVGRRGSRLDLALNALYFRAGQTPAFEYGQMEPIRRSNLAIAIPMHVRFEARRHPVVGTTLDYFDYRSLKIAKGRNFATLGECILGAKAATTLGLSPGDHLTTTPSTTFDLAGTYPLEMAVVGVLAPSDTADDGAVFVDLKTAWIIEGFGHGHQDLNAPEAASSVLSREGSSVTANASLVQFQRITRDNMSQFHFHGDLSSLPISAILAAPHDDRAGTILAGRYLDADQPLQILQPVQVITELLQTILTLESFAMIAMVAVTLGTLAVVGLVCVLSVRLRQSEIQTMELIGVARGRLAIMLGLEISILAGSAVMLALAWGMAAMAFGPQLIRAML